MACDGACAKGEVARRAANLVAYHLAREHNVRICLSGAFTKDGGQRDLVRRSKPAIAIEGCFLFCSSRMMKGALPGLEPVIAQADMYYDNDLPVRSRRDHGRRAAGMRPHRGGGAWSGTTEPARNCRKRKLIVKRNGQHLVRSTTKSRMLQTPVKGEDFVR